MIVWVNVLGFQTAYFAFAFFVAVRRKFKRVTANAAASRTFAVFKSMAFIRVFDYAATTPSAHMPVCIVPILGVPDRFADMVSIIEITFRYAAVFTQTSLDGTAGCRLPVVSEGFDVSCIDEVACGTGKYGGAGSRGYHGAVLPGAVNGRHAGIHHRPVPYIRGSGGAGAGYDAGGERV